MNEFTIKELEQLSGIKAHTIRIWEQRYNFLKPRRTATNIRCYSCEELRTVLNIALLNKSGFKISHIGQMRPDEICQKILSLGDSQAAEEMVVNELVRHMATLDTRNFEKILDEQVCIRGMEHMILHIVFPFLDKLGILWQTGNITAAQEHLVSNIIRNKLIAAIETAKAKSSTGKSFLLFLPEGEHHELGLLFMHYLLKARGSNVIYLGANIPVKEASLLAKAKKPDFIFIHLSSAAINFQDFLDELQKHMKGFPVVVSGQPARSHHKKPPSNISLKKSVAEVKEFLLTSM